MSITSRFVKEIGISLDLSRMFSTLIQANIRVRCRIDLIYTFIYNACRVIFQVVSAEIVASHNLEGFRNYIEKAYRDQFLYSEG